MRIKTGQVTMQLCTALFLLGISAVAPVKHSLEYFYTLSSEAPNFPEFVAVILVDEVQIIHYNRNMKSAEPKQDWVNKITEDIPAYWEKRTERLKLNQEMFKSIIETAKPCLNYTGGLYIVQGILSCDWDDESDEVNVFTQFGYDGEDFLSLDMKTQTWIPLHQQAVVVKELLDNNKPLLTYFKHYFTQECRHWLKKFLNYGKSSLMRKDLPSVSLLQKTPSSPLTCHATGFYPDRADLFWKKDEEELHEDVVKGEILPNHDGSFQMSVDLDLSGLKDEDWGRYSCVFHLAVGQEVSKRLDKRDIRTNWREKRSRDKGFPSAVVVGLLLLAIIALFLLWRRNIQTSESSPSSGEDPAVKKEISEKQTMLQTT
ncbi:major histocompatibility complex class I-related gene protein-like [Salarias fasciatus]|uniref:major histocompatibility complex class I-related gene protein-like n=1 Tax=Salarias fasciatus TaxID=181472 RepID=UPI001176D940|nr:major histocompatibility complex class I-related gene protein-like [Salarias fasciatus]